MQHTTYNVIQKWLALKLKHVIPSVEQQRQKEVADIQEQVQ
jgi:hypothetical protein